MVPRFVNKQAGFPAVPLPQPGTDPMQALLLLLPERQNIGRVCGRDRERFSSVIAFGENYITVLSAQLAPSQETC